jgi:hypothetical protein
VDSLGLKGDDRTGMWMLNYPFPYDDPSVGQAFRDMCDDLYEAVAGAGSREERVAAYRASSRRFRDLLSDDDYRYYAFQLWQEGIARYTEYKLARRVAVAYQPTTEFESLPDVTPFEDDAKRTWEKILNELRSMSLKESRRKAFYYVGAALGVLLDRESPGWRERYMHNRFYIEEYAKPTMPGDG